MPDRSSPPQVSESEHGGAGVCVLGDGERLPSRSVKAQTQSWRYECTQRRAGRCGYNFFYGRRHLPLLWAGLAIGILWIKISNKIS